MNKWALITGATSGIGEATATRLAAQNWNLILVGRRQFRLEALEKKFSESVKVITAAVDIQDLPAVQAFVRERQTEMANVELLVNNAGLAKGTDKAQDAQLSDWETMIDTNLKGLLYFTRLILPFMIKNNRGHIVNIGSVAGRWVYPGGAVYCATKFAVRGFTDGLRMDLMGTRIRVTNVEPGMVETEFSEVRLGDKAKAAQVYENMKPLSAGDVADAVIWSISRPSHVNVQELVLFPTDQPAVGMVHRTP